MDSFMGKMGNFLAHKDRVLSEILILWIDEKMLKLFLKASTNEIKILLHYAFRPSRCT